MSAPGELVDHLFRRQAGRMVSTLTRIFGPRYLEMAEDVVQEALVKALEQWPHRGVPANPAAWLMEVAKNRGLDRLRREATLAAKAEDLARAFSGTGATAASEMDDQLAMMFLCCHPAIPRAGVFHPGCAAIRDDHFGGKRAGAYGQVRARPCRFQVLAA